jgi:diguanylate cyclase (GGDEF)-like protein
VQATDANNKRTIAAEYEADTVNEAQRPYVGTGTKALNAGNLGGIELFRDVDPGAVAHLLEECTEHQVRGGEVLLDPRLPNDCVYLVMSGRLEVRHGAPDGAVIAVLEAGACAGEMSMIEGLAPNAFVVAVEDSYLIGLKHATLWALVHSSHAGACNLLTLLLRRVHADKQFLRESTGKMRAYRRRSVTDALTELYNRHGMELFFPRAIDRCRRNRDPACLVVVDVDHFREFNNRHGHLVGDDVLTAVAERIQYCFRSTDLRARYGGDEFTVLLPRTDLAQALKTAERLRVAVSRCRPLEPEDLHVTVSIGVASLVANDTLERLFGRADAALRRAKQTGRNRLSI